MHGAAVSGGNVELPFGSNKKNLTDSLNSHCWLNDRLIINVIFGVSNGPIAFDTYKNWIEFWIPPAFGDNTHDSCEDHL